MGQRIRTVIPQKDKTHSERGRLSINRHCLSNKVYCNRNQSNETMLMLYMLVSLQECFNGCTLVARQNTSYEGGCGIRMCIEAFIEVLTWAINKYFWLSNNLKHKNKL